MTRRHWSRWFLVACFAALPLGAQPAKPAKTPAKPAPSAAPAPADPAPISAADEASGDEEEPELPPGHPSVGATNPHGAGGGGERLNPDRNQADPSLPVGSVEAMVVDEKENPLIGVEVRLGILKQSIAEGNSRDFRVATSDARGKVRFDGLEGGSKFSYRITTRKDPAEYASSPFNLGEKSGQSVLLHVYPVTGDIQKAQVGMRGMLVVDPRDDTFQFEAMFQVFNVGSVTWVPDGVTLQLPKEYRAFNSEESMDDTRFVEETGRGARMVGTFSPGQRDLTFRFSVPSDEKETAEFVIQLPPHVAELRVMVPAAREMRLEVEGFNAAEPMTGQDGRRLLVVQRQLRPGEPEMREVAIRLSGIPTPSSGRWVAVGLSLSVLLAGLFLTSRDRRTAGQVPAKDGERAQRLLLGELVALERAFIGKEIGPRTYEQARRALLDALTRLEARMPRKPPLKRRQRPRDR
jgi:hypothetical protein